MIFEFWVQSKWQVWTKVWNELTINKYYYYNNISIIMICLNILIDLCVRLFVNFLGFKIIQEVILVHFCLSFITDAWTWNIGIPRRDSMIFTCASTSYRTGTLLTQKNDNWSFSISLKIGLIGTSEFLKWATLNNTLTI